MRRCGDGHRGSARVALCPCLWPVAVPVRSRPNNSLTPTCSGRGYPAARCVWTRAREGLALARARRGHRAVVEAGNGGGRHGGDVERVRGEDCQDPTPPATSDPTPSAAAALREREGAEGEGTAGATRLGDGASCAFSPMAPPLSVPPSAAVLSRGRRQRAAFSTSRPSVRPSTTPRRRRRPDSVVCACPWSPLA